MHENIKQSSHSTDELVENPEKPQDALIKSHSNKEESDCRKNTRKKIMFRVAFFPPQGA